MSSFPTLRLKPGRERPLRNGHPWVFSGAIDAIESELEPGGLVEIVGADGKWIARATYNPHSSVRARVLTWDPDETPDAAWLRRRLEASIARRRRLGLFDPAGALRLVYAEADGLPGLLVDRYANVLVVTMAIPFWEAHRATLVELLVGMLSPRSVYERSDTETRKREGLETRVGLLWGEEPPELVPFHEGTLRFLADVREGQKTGFYLDQRENRARVASYAGDRRVLNVFSYTGAFGVAALTAGAAHVLNMDTSASALALGERIAAENGVADRWESLEADAFKALRAFRDEGRTFGLIVLDPPKFAHARNQVDRACRGYKDLNLLAMKLLEPGGILATFSCTGLVSPHLFRQVVAAAAMDAKREIRLLEKRTQPPDHPILMTFPESEYLKGMILIAD